MLWIYMIQEYFVLRDFLNFKNHHVTLTKNYGFVQN